MPLNKERFNEAFREALSCEFKDIPRDEEQIDYTFSPSFEKRMNKLIAAEKKPTWKFINTARKRAVLIAAIIVMLMTAAFSVSAIREPIVKFFVELHETFAHYVMDGDKRDAITTEYQITKLPDGFVQTDKKENPTRIMTTYENSVGDILELLQTITKGVDMFVDTENSEEKIITVLDREIHVYTRPGFVQAIWVQGTSLMTLTHYGEMDTAEIVEIIQSIKETT